MPEESDLGVGALGEPGMGVRLGCLYVGATSFGVAVSARSASPGRGDFLDLT